MGIIYNLSFSLIWNQVNDIVNDPTTTPIINWILDFGFWDDGGYWVDTAIWND